MSGANLADAKLTGATLRHANLTGAVLARANLTEADLSEGLLEGADLSEAIIREANLERTNLSRADLAHANLSAAILFGANLTDANLERATLVGASFERANLERTKLIGVNLAEADLSETNLIRADLTGGNLDRAVLAGSVLEAAKLSRAVLTQANLIMADLTEADLTGANFAGAVLYKANIAAAIYDEGAFKDADIEGTTPQELVAPVEIYRQEDLSYRERETLQAAIDEFMEACGFEHQIDYEPRHGSFWQRLKFWSKERMTPREADAIYEQGKAALLANYLDKPAADTTDKMADAARKLIDAIQCYENSVLRVGSLLVVKMGKEHLRVETITPELARALAGNPVLLKGPEVLMGLIENQQQLSDSTSDKETTEETSVLKPS